MNLRLKFENNKLFLSYGSRIQTIWNFGPELRTVWIIFYHLISFLVMISRIHRRYPSPTLMTNRLDLGFFEIHEKLIEFCLFLGMAGECLHKFLQILWRKFLFAIENICKYSFDKWNGWKLWRTVYDMWGCNKEAVVVFINSGFLDSGESTWFYWFSSFNLWNRSKERSDIFLGFSF